MAGKKKKKDEGIEIPISAIDEASAIAKRVQENLEKLKKAGTGKAEISGKVDIDTSKAQRDIDALASKSAAALDKTDKAIKRSAEVQAKAFYDAASAVRKAQAAASAKALTPQQVFANLTQAQISQYSNIKSQLVSLVGNAAKSSGAIVPADLFKGLNKKFAEEFSTLTGLFRQVQALRKVIDLIRDREQIADFEAGATSEPASGMRSVFIRRGIDAGIRDSVFDYNNLAPEGRRLKVGAQGSLSQLFNVSIAELTKSVSQVAFALDRLALRLLVATGGIPVEKSLALMPDKDVDRALGFLRKAGVVQANVSVKRGVSLEDYQNYLQDLVAGGRPLGTTRRRRIRAVPSVVPTLIGDVSSYWQRASAPPTDMARWFIKAVEAASPEMRRALEAFFESAARIRTGRLPAQASQSNFLYQFPRPLEEVLTRVAQLRVPLTGDPNKGRILPPPDYEMVITPKPKAKQEVLTTGRVLSDEELRQRIAGPPRPEFPGIRPGTGRYSAGATTGRIQDIEKAWEMALREDFVRGLSKVPKKTIPFGQEGFADLRLLLGLNPLTLPFVGLAKLFKFLKGLGESGFANIPITPQQVAQARARSTTTGGIGGGNIPPVIFQGGGGGSDDDDNRRIPHGRRIGSAFTGLVAYVTAATAVYSALGAFQTAIQQAVDFEEKLAQLRGLLPSRGMTEILLIQDSVIKNASRYGQSVTEVLDVAQALIQTGRSATEVLEDLDQVMRGATGLNLPLNSAKELLVAIRSITLDLSTGRSGITTDVFDRIAVAQERAAVSSYDLSEAIKTIAPTARALRGQFVGLTDEVDIVLASIGRIVQGTGVPGAQAATSLRNTLARLGRPEVLRAIQDIGGAKLGTIESGGRELRPLREILGELSRVYKELNSADRQRLLTQIAGSRQTNALQVLLTNYNGVLEDSERSALAFGNAQQRTGYVLETTRNKINQVTTSLQGIGTALLQSEILGGTFRTVLTGIANALRFISKDIDSVVPKFAALAAVIFGLLRVFKFFGTASLFSLGFRTRAELNVASQAFGAFGTLVTNVSAKIKGALGKNVLLGGLVSALGPGGTLALVLAGLAGVYYLLKQVYDYANRFNNFKFEFLTPEQAAQTAAPRIEEFKTKAKDYGLEPLDLLTGVKTTAQEAFPALAQLAGGMDKISKLTRTEIFTTVFPLLTKNIKGFEASLAKATEGLPKAEANAKRLQITMDLLGEAAFFRSGVLQKNYNELVRQTEDFKNRFVAVFDELAKSTNKIDLFTPGLRGIRGEGISTRRTITDLVGQVARQARTLDPEISVLFELLVKSGTETGVFSDAFERLDKVLKASGNTILDTRDFLSQFSLVIEKTVDQAERSKLIEDFAKRIRQVVDRSGKLDLTAAILGTPAEQQSNASRVFGSFFSATFDQVKLDIFKELGGDDELRLVRLFENSGRGIRLLAQDLNSILIGVKNPLTEFLQELFFTVQGFNAAEQAARSFGLSMADLSFNKVQALEQMGKKLSELPLQAFKDLLDAEQQRAELLLISSRLENIPNPVDEVEIQTLQSEKQRINNQIRSVDARIAALSRFTGQFDIQEEADSLIFDVQALTRNNPKAADEVQQLLNTIQNDPALLDARARASAIIEAITSFLRTYLAEARGDLSIDLQRRAAIETNRVLGLSRASAQNELTLARIRQTTDLAAFGLTPLEAVDAQVRGINQEKQAGLALAEATLAIEKRALREQLERFEASETEFITKSRDLQTTYERQIAEIQITEQKRIQLAIDEAIFEQNRRNAEQIQSNLQARLSGLKEVLSDYDKFRKGSIQTILGPAGKNFIDRQADILLTAFNKGGPLSKIGELIGGAGEQEKIVTAHTTGAAIVAQAIVSAHTIGAGIAAGSRVGQPGVSIAGEAAASVAAASAASNEDFKKLRGKQLKTAIASIGGYLIGSAAGGGGQGAQTGASIGAGLGTLTGNPLIALAGGVVGGLFGGLFDKGKDSELPVVALEKIARDTGTQVTLLENTNRLLEAQNLAFNVPSSFRLPQYGAQLFAGQASVTNDITVNVSVGSTTVSAQELGKAVSEAVATRLQKEYNSGGSYTTRTSY